MAVVVTERTDPASTGISVGSYVTVRTIGGSIAAAGFAAVLNLATNAGTRIPREWAYVAIWLSCGLAALVALLVVAVSRPTKAEG